MTPLAYAALAFSDACSRVPSPMERPLVYLEWNGFRPPRPWGVHEANDGRLIRSFKELELALAWMKDGPKVRAAIRQLERPC